MSDNNFQNLERNDFFPEKFNKLKELLKDKTLNTEDFIHLNSKFFITDEINEDSQEAKFYIEYINFLHNEKKFDWNKVYFDLNNGLPENLALYMIENDYPVSVVQSLFDNGYNPNSAIMTSFDTPLFMHCLTHKREYLPLLLKSKVDVYKSNSLDENFIKYCIDKNEYDLFKLIIKDNPLPSSKFSSNELNRIIYAFCNLIHYNQYENIGKFFEDIKDTGINENNRMHDVFKGLFDKYKYTNIQDKIYNLIDELFNKGIQSNLSNRNTASQDPLIITFIEKYWTHNDSENIEDLTNDRLFSLILKNTVDLENIHLIPWDEWLSYEDIVEVKKWTALKEKEKIIDSINDNLNCETNKPAKKRI